MENTKKVKSIKKKDQIVKLNKKKIIIITTIIIVILAGLGIGLYFAFRPDKVPLPNGAAHWVSVEDARKKAEETSEGTKENPKMVGIYFGVENSDISKLALYGNDYTDQEKWDELNGPFSEYLESGITDIEWYCINSSNDGDNQKNMEKFFYDNNSEDEDYDVYDNAVHKGWESTWFSTDAKDNSTKEVNGWNKSWSKTDISFEEESDEDSLDDDNNYQLIFSGVTIDYTMPTWMWFRNGELYAVVNGMAHTEDEETGEITIESSGDNKINDDYWFNMEEIVKNQSITDSP